LVRALAPSLYVKRPATFPPPRLLGLFRTPTSPAYGSERVITSLPLPLSGGKSAPSSFDLTFWFHPAAGCSAEMLGIAFGISTFLRCDINFFSPRSDLTLVCPFFCEPSFSPSECPGLFFPEYLEAFPLYPSPAIAIRFSSFLLVRPKYLFFRSDRLLILNVTSFSSAPPRCTGLFC